MSSFEPWDSALFQAFFGHHKCQLSSRALVILAVVKMMMMMMPLMVNFLILGLQTGIYGRRCEWFCHINLFSSTCFHTESVFSLASFKIRKVCSVSESMMNLLLCLLVNIVSSPFYEFLLWAEPPRVLKVGVVMGEGEVFPRYPCWFPPLIHPVDAPHALAIHLTRF